MMIIIFRFIVKLPCSVYMLTLVELNLLGLSFRVEIVNVNIYLC